MDTVLNSGTRLRPVVWTGSALRAPRLAQGNGSPPVDSHGDETRGERRVCRRRESELRSLFEEGPRGGRGAVTGAVYFRCVQPPAMQQTQLCVLLTPPTKVHDRRSRAGARVILQSFNAFRMVDWTAGVGGRLLPSRAHPRSRGTRRASGGRSCRGEPLRLSTHLGPEST